MAVTRQSISTVFDVGASVYNNAPALRDLIAATSEDNVHAQVILAAEQLGAWIPASRHLFGPAVDALGGQTSVKVENFRAWIGLRSGGVCRMIRQSTPLLQFFLFCAACKTTLIDEDCSVLLYQMLSESGLLLKFPCSVGQIERLVAAFSAQAEMLTPADLLHTIASDVAEFAPQIDIITKSDSTELAKLLVALFEHLRDDTVDSIQLEGHDNSVWVMSTLYWLLQEDSFILVADKVIQGKPDAKCCLRIIPTKISSWKLQVWKRDCNPVEYVVDTKTEYPQTYRLPLRLTKSYVDQSFLDLFLSTSDRNAAIRVCGQLAQTLITVISQRGSISAECQWCEGLAPCNVAALADVAQDSWLAKCGSMMTEYGWESSLTHAPDLMEAILAVLDRWAASHWAERDTDGADSEITELCCDFITAAFPSEILQDDGYHDIDEHFDRILGPAFLIAVDAVLTCTTELISGARRYIKVPPTGPNQGELGSIITSLLVTALDVSRFRQSAIAQLLPESSMLSPEDLAVASSGQVVGMSMLWSPSLQQKHALAIRVQLGQIRTKDAIYDAIREGTMLELLSANEGADPRAWHMPHDWLDAREAWQHLGAEYKYRFETSTSLRGNVIDIRHHLVFEDGGVGKSAKRRKASWWMIIDRVATAHHMALVSPPIDLRIAAALQTRMEAVLRERNVRWIGPFRYADVPENTGALTSTGGNVMVKIFCAGMNIGSAKACCRLVVRHGSTLLQSLQVANTAAATWIIID